MVFSLGNDALFKVPPPPSLLYKVDTSRPCLRTNWTRLFKVWELGTGAMRRALQSESRARFLGACLDTRNQVALPPTSAGSTPCPCGCPQ